MEIGKPRNGNVIEFSARLAKESMPVGAVFHKPPKSGRWTTKKPKVTTRLFNIFGPCEGDRYEVIDLGITLAREALERGEKEFAEKILIRLKELEREDIRKVVSR